MAIWEARRNLVDGTLADLKATRVGSPNGFELILERILGNPLPDLATLRSNLVNGNDVGATLTTITDVLHPQLSIFRLPPGT